MAVTPGLVKPDTPNRLPHPDLDAAKEAALSPTRSTAIDKPGASIDDLIRMVVLSDHLTAALQAAKRSCLYDRRVHLYAAENYVDELRERIRMFS